jgi:hypothetical protein
MRLRGGEKIKYMSQIVYLLWIFKLPDKGGFTTVISVVMLINPIYWAPWTEPCILGLRRKTIWLTELTHMHNPQFRKLSVSLCLSRVTDPLNVTTFWSCASVNMCIFFVPAAENPKSRYYEVSSVKKQHSFEKESVNIFSFMIASINYFLFHWLAYGIYKVIELKLRCIHLFEFLMACWLHMWTPKSF